MNKSCKICSTEFTPNSNRSEFCSIRCKNKNTFNKKQEALLKGTEGIDYVIDMWNGYATPRIYGMWMKSMHPGKTTADYLNEFPTAQLQCENDKNATSKNSGLHMKRPEYRKMAADAIKGERNPNHSNNVSKEVRKQRSPFSKNFIKWETEEDHKNFINSIDYESRLTSVDLEWWINLGYSEIEAKERLKERQTTFTLDKCIEKYGLEGTKVFTDRQEKWSKKVEEKYKNGDFTRFCKNNWSKTEEEFIKELVKVLQLNDNEYYSAINGKQFFRNFKEIGKTFAYDFTYGKKIIEFNGDYWHCNPNIYEAEYFNKSLKCTSKERWGFDIWKNSLIEKEGYQVLTVWESEWNNDPELVLKKCINFLHD
jgi:hypothetical protein